MDLAEQGVRVAVAVVSIFVFAVGAVAFARHRTPRVGIVLALFATFLVEGVLLLVEVFWIDTPLTETAYYAFQLVEVLLVAAVLVVRS